VIPSLKDTCVSAIAAYGNTAVGRVWKLYMCFGYCKFGENPVLLGSVHVLPGFVHGSSACQLRIQLLLGAAIKERNNVCFCLHLPCTLFSWQVCVSSVLSKSSSKTCFFLFGAAQLERDVFRCFMRISRFAPL
jgi:hypothetical protein